ncbi:5-guanidino-2-oxopentanoate decarboxylase [Martelella soudanensis]|uniref:5-guanidino-2-oxopentanoate decarboxylase n=1 Tax=unclassified Martelella TaxID=2629616 RepID=UPI0015E04839|nr:MULTISPECIES: 5-guanidino-2-oxopentanoate decarboxylase [unclassified Martelella]
MSTDMSVGEALVHLLEAHGVEIVFGIPGVHTAELYRGLAASKIRHVTPRHEQGAGFMADGYARVTGRPGVCFVITGPGLTNTITAMAQARADSVPMLVVSGVNARSTLGRGQGYLHELPDQSGLIRSFAKASFTLTDASELAGTLARSLALAISGRPGPVHLEIPTDVMVARLPKAEMVAVEPAQPQTDAGALKAATALIAGARAPVILAGGGAIRADLSLRIFAERIDAPVVLTVNGRGLLADHALRVPASPSLAPVRDLLAASDLVIAVGTEFGPTDYDMYADGGFPTLRKLVRLDISEGQIGAGPEADVALVGDSSAVLSRLLDMLPETGGRNGAARADAARRAAMATLEPRVAGEVALLQRLYGATPHARFVGDSTQLVYAGNLYCDAPRPGHWFNAATGYGALGYVPPGAIGAALADPAVPVVAIVGDGGLQFSLGEIGVAAEERLDVVFLVWNNHGYREIETFMLDAGIAPVGVKPPPPDMALIAKAYGLGFRRAEDEAQLVEAVAVCARKGGAHLVEYAV